MGRRRRRRAKDEGFVTEVGGATLRLSHRVPLIGLLFAAACGAGWWWLRGRPDAFFGANYVGLALAGLAGVFLLIALIGLLRNLFPHAKNGRDARR